MRPDVPLKRTQQEIASLMRDMVVVLVTAHQRSKKTRAALMYVVTGQDNNKGMFHLT